MPVYESACTTAECQSRGTPIEWYTGDRSKPDPNCGDCGQPMRRMISPFGVVFTGPITGKYLDHKAEVKGEDGSHWAWETKGPDGQKLANPRPVRIETFQDQRDFCRREGLVDPSSIGPAEIHADGRGVSTRGLPGCW